MSKPRIYGNCPAGCQWETIHKDDFLKACSLVEVDRDKRDDNWYLETGKQYKIFSENNSYIIALNYFKDGRAKTYYFGIPTDKYSKYVVFRFLEIVADTNYLEFVYEIAGARYTETITDTGLSLDENNTHDLLYVERTADAVYIYNEDASFSVAVEKSKVSAMKTLSVESWDNTAKTQTVSMNVDIYKRNEIDVEPESIEEWASCGVYAISENETGITFKYTNKPTNALKFRVASSEVEYVSE